MGIKIITPFIALDLAKNAGAYSMFYNLRDLFFGITDQVLGVQAVADATTTSTDVTITIEGSLDGTNFDTAVDVLANANLSDGAHDFGSFNIGKAYSIIRFKAKDNNSNPVVDLYVWISIPTSQIVR